MKYIILLVAFVSSTLVASAQDLTIQAFSKSYAYENEKEYGKAIAELSQDNLNEAGSYSINLRLGWLWYLNGDYMKSKSQYQKAIDLNPNSIEALLGLAAPVAAMENWTEVMVLYHKILIIDPRHTLANYRLASLNHYIKKDNKSALKFVSRVLDLHPFDFDSNYLLAIIQVSLGNIKEAKSAIKLALEYNPESKDAWAIYETVK